MARCDMGACTRTNTCDIVTGEQSLPDAVALAGPQELQRAVLRINVDAGVFDQPQLAVRRMMVGSVAFATATPTSSMRGAPAERGLAMVPGCDGDDALNLGAVCCMCSSRPSTPTSTATGASRVC